MPTLLEALDKRELAIFDASELDEFVQGMYILIRAAVRDHCDSLVISQRDISRCKGNVTVWTTVLAASSGISFMPNMRDAFLKILERDQLVRDHLLLERNDDVGSVYKIVYSHVDDGR